MRGESRGASGSFLGACPGPFLAPARSSSRLRVCRAELGCPSGLGGESESGSPSTKTPCSQQILPGRGAFFSNDSAAREWEGLSPRLWDCDQRFWHEIPLGPHGGGRRAPGLLSGRARIREGSEGSGGGAAAPLCRAGAWRRLAPPAPGRGWGANGQEMEVGELVSMETGIQWTAAHVCTRILNSTRQAWQTPRYQAHGQSGPGRGRTPNTQPARPSTPKPIHSEPHWPKSCFCPGEAQPCPCSGYRGWFLGTEVCRDGRWVWSLTAAAAGTQEALVSPQQHRAVFNY